jgi:hypothetical protein
VSTIIDILNGLNPRCPTSSFAAIARIHSRPRVEAGLSGREPFDGPTSLKYLAVARKLKNLSESVRIPLDGMSESIRLPLDWSQVDVIRAVLDAVDGGTLTISVHKSEPIAPPEPLFLVYLNGTYFVRRSALRPGGQSQVQTTLQTTGAPQMTKACADRIVEALAKIGHRAQVVVSRVTGSGIDDFESLWTPDEVKTEQV